MLYIIRGLPGSGKTTLAKRMVKEAADNGYKMVHCEADHYFEKKGHYCFKPDELDHAHAECQQNVVNALAEGYDVVVSNTFVTLWELEPYFKLAAQFKCGLMVQEMMHVYGNIHKVPEHTMRRMQMRWEHLNTQEVG